MGSSCQNKKVVFDPVRKSWVAATPEEIVRQTLIQRMVEQMQFPVSNLLVEQELKKFPHLAHRKASLPDRRIDIVCLSTGLHRDFHFFPLLLIECKDEPLSLRARKEITSQFETAPKPRGSTIARGDVLTNTPTSCDRSNRGSFRAVSNAEVISLRALRAFEQVIGYNHFIQAPFIAVANMQEIQTGFWDNEQQQYVFIPFLPTYSELLKRIR